MRFIDDERNKKYDDAYANLLALAFIPSLPAMMVVAISSSILVACRFVWRFFH
jgi:hypothetical protein